MSKEKRPVNFRADVDDVKIFQRLYPNCLTRFLRKAIKRAIEDKTFLFNILFNQEI